jgi:hypothetical protein
MARIVRLRLDPARILRASRICIGDRIEIRGVPSILLGVSAIVAVAGLARAVGASAPTLPESLREATKLVAALRGEHGERDDQRRLNG